MLLLIHAISGWFASAEHWRFNWNLPCSEKGYLCRCAWQMFECCCSLVKEDLRLPPAVLAYHMRFERYQILSCAIYTDGKCFWQKLSVMLLLLQSERGSVSIFCFTGPSSSISFTRSVLFSRETENCCWWGLHWMRRLNLWSSLQCSLS